MNQKKIPGCFCPMFKKQDRFIAFHKPESRRETVFLGTQLEVLKRSLHQNSYLSSLHPPVLYGIGTRPVPQPVTQSQKAQKKPGSSSQYDDPDTDIVKGIDHGTILPMTAIPPRVIALASGSLGC
jgi:hypothetical protein